ncbi:RNA methyltransferase [Paenibacillus sp. CAA11]|uniref:RsmB/NOP family class I SAM-dependent RNA methyltransferase n=1 Tax=Paenibacillus sp. CAA11 TaxID=1532905 RepID=UPI000D37E07E|nr:RsmB/NOP family class I SAM-dependent RNA methyltransferase [Paenibacillus sp. CAA11]AWB44178.1 RNA methyltransferase [Paenibacillus sp. CAA11]
MSDIQLPEAYRYALTQQLGDEEGARFLHSYNQPRTFGLRINTLKLELGSPVFHKLEHLFSLRAVPWCPEGFYYEESTRPGRHLYHAAGIYYIQEPSAMSAVQLLDPQPGETILDLAAAPGGKSTQIAARMQGKGVLITNEIHPQRAKILAENIERLGIRNAIVTQATPAELSAKFPLAFDRIMLDAPCSGEGMFRKDPAAIQEWSEASVQFCAARQRDILHDAIAMLKPGGTLAYSTCTFNRQENEENMAYVLQTYPFMELIREHRIWPQQSEGEGHYVALLRRVDEGDEMLASPSGKRSRKASSKQRGANHAAMVQQEFEAWAKDHLRGFEPSGTYLSFGEAIYMLPHSRTMNPDADLLKGLKTPRPGLKLGVAKKGRFEPDHALAAALKPEEAIRRFNLASDSADGSAYLRGETLSVPDSIKGWTLVTADNFPLGWGKASGGQLKNHLPKGLRLQL